MGLDLRALVLARDLATPFFAGLVFFILVLEEAFALGFALALALTFALGFALGLALGLTLARPGLAAFFLALEGCFAEAGFFGRAGEGGALVLGLDSISTASAASVASVSSSSSSSRHPWASRTAIMALRI